MEREQFQWTEARQSGIHETMEAMMGNQNDASSYYFVVLPTALC